MRICHHAVIYIIVLRFTYFLNGQSYIYWGSCFILVVQFILAIFWSKLMIYLLIMFLLKSMNSILSPSLISLFLNSFRGYIRSMPLFLFHPLFHLIIVFSIFFRGCNFDLWMGFFDLIPWSRHNCKKHEYIWYH